MKRLILLLVLALPLLADDVQKLHALFDRTWEFQLKEEPLFATSVGRHEYNDRLASITPADLKRQADFMKAALEGMPERMMPQPDGLVTVRINSQTGLRAGPNEPGAIFEIFREEDVPPYGDTATQTTTTQPGAPRTESVPIF